LADITLRASEERHALRNEIAARDVQIANLQHEVEQLRAEVAELRRRQMRQA
jgi:predicted  nucleic acid-binding Zn-ribbon protein